MKPFPGDWMKEDKNFNFSPKVSPPSVHRAGQKEGVERQKKTTLELQKKGVFVAVEAFCV
jgi:hypothetical protein